MAKIRWIHFSDLHLNQMGTETKRMRKKLVTYLKELNIICDYAFCTGDIRNAPSGDFPEDASKRIEEICEALHIPQKRFFIVPGNHDIDRDIEDRVETIETIVTGDKSHSAYDAKDGTISEENLKQIAKGKGIYFNFLDTISDKIFDISKAKNVTKPHYVVKTEDFNIVHVDSTLFYASNRQKDFILGTNLLMEILEEVNPEKLTIILTHYSFDFLERNEQRELVALFNDYNVRLWLAGHEHNHLARIQWDCFYEFQCGNLVLENGAVACILLGEYDTEKEEGNIQAHAWYPQKDWAIYPFLAERGVDKSKYIFNISQVNDEQKTGKKANFEKEQREQLWLSIFSLLEENRVIFETYGPTAINRDIFINEYIDNWHMQVKDVILPNSKRIIELLENNLQILNASEKEILYRYKQHVNGFEKNHLVKDQFVMDAPQFPKEIYDILKCEE